MLLIAVCKSAVLLSAARDPCAGLTAMPLLASCCSTCPMATAAGMWMLPSSRPSGAWPPSAPEVKRPKVSDPL